MGCIIDGCTKCTGTTSLAANTPLDFFLIQNGKLEGMDALVLLGDTRAVYTYDEWLNAPFPTSEDMGSTEFTDALQDLFDYMEPCKCKLESAAFGQVSYCDGCQSGCTITAKK